MSPKACINWITRTCVTMYNNYDFRKFFRQLMFVPCDQKIIFSFLQNVFFQSNDLKGVKAYASVDVEGVYTLGTVVVDYRGYRVTAQSIIPGMCKTYVGNRLAESYHENVEILEIHGLCCC